MNAKDIKEAIDFVSDPNTRAAFVSGFTIALFLGYFAGIISCKWLYGVSHMISSGIRNYFLRKARLREEERKRKEEAAKRRLEACERRKNEKRSVHGVLWDRNGNPYCPVCQRPIRPFEYLNYSSSFISSCYACRQTFYCRTEKLAEEVRKKWEE